MIQKIKPGLDIILDILKESLEAYPESEFVKSLLFQYQEKGGLSKKQLEGLYGKALKVTTITPGKLATLEAIIKKKPTRYKSPLPSIAPLPVKDDNTGMLIAGILAGYPQHKRVLYFKLKFDNNEAISPAEIAELEKFYKLLVKQPL